MGEKYYESTMPRLVEVLEGLSKQLEELVEALTKEEVREPEHE